MPDAPLAVTSSIPRYNSGARTPGPRRGYYHSGVWRSCLIEMFEVANPGHKALRMSFECIFELLVNSVIATRIPVLSGPDSTPGRSPTTFEFLRL